METFYGNATSGMVTKIDIPQLAFYPKDSRNTFGGTHLKTTSEPCDFWGLEYTAPLPQFTFTINQTSTGDFIVPINGHTN
jgi:hypothetical protein